MNDLKEQYINLLESKGVEVDMGMWVEIGGLDQDELGEEIEFINSTPQKEINTLFNLKIMEHTENNKLIAVFMDAVIIGQGERQLIAYPDTKMEDGMGTISNNRSIKDLHYHSEWNWLMPVVDKIENLGYEITISNSRCKVNHNTDQSTKEIYHAETQYSKIDATYKVVIEFINEHNKSI